ncbi:MAG: PGPGW domain-containing protein [Verrucomicrobiota bacterium]|nr:PGPGW domain-containing protein [Verrucomicrobiota bacterium]MDQ6939320.1 PGPGW domain-containing protein [Verrucomicrobiota bacterium]
MTAEPQPRRWQERLNTRLGLDKMPRVRKVVYSVVGSSVILIGIVMIVLPGPAIIVIPLGLAILASEYAWARAVLRRGKIFVDKVRGRKVV